MAYLFQSTWDGRISARITRVCIRSRAYRRTPLRRPALILSWFGGDHRGEKVVEVEDGIGHQAGVDRAGLDDCAGGCGQPVPALPHPELRDRTGIWVAR